MALSPAQERVLDDLVASLPDDVTWCVFGSVDSVLRGLDDDPADVDVLTTARGGRAFREAFADGFVQSRDVGDSRIDEYRLHGEELEVIYPDDEHHEPLVDLGAVELTAADRGVPLLPLDPLVDAYRRIDKHETADRLVAAFGPTDG